MGDLLRYVLGGFLVLHGLTHLGLMVAPDSGEDNAVWGYVFADGRARLLPELGLARTTIHRVAGVLLAGSTAAFIVSGMALLTSQGWWRAVGFFGAAASLALVTLYWHRSLRIGTLIDVVIIAVLVLAP